MHHWVSNGKFQKGHIKISHESKEQSEGAKERRSGGAAPCHRPASEITDYQLPTPNNSKLIPSPPRYWLKRWQRLIWNILGTVTTSCLTYRLHSAAVRHVSSQAREFGRRWFQKNLPASLSQSHKHLHVRINANLVEMICCPLFQHSCAGVSS